MSCKCNQVVQYPSMVGAICVSVANKYWLRVINDNTCVGTQFENKRNAECK